MSQLKAFFDTFGYVVVRGALASDVGWIADEHAAVFRDVGTDHTGDSRTVIVPFIDQRERLCTLLDHPAITGLLSALIGEDFNYLAGDGNYYSGDTGWHSDGSHAVGTFVKIAIYLDPVTRDTGALRVIPGSHLVLDRDARKARDAEELWGVEGRDVPSIALGSNPGDIVCFNHNLMHSSWGGGRARRMFTLNCSARARTPEEIAELRAYISGHSLYHMERLSTETMRSTASPERWVHLEQGLEHEDVLPPLTAERRAKGEPPLAVSAGTGR
jgi:hypothetical protein